MELTTRDVRLAGLVTETAMPRNRVAEHWLMFLFEVMQPIEQLPPENREGDFGFFDPTTLERVPIAETDRRFLWPAFWSWRSKREVFSLHCHVAGDGSVDGYLEGAPSREGRP